MKLPSVSTLLFLLGCFAHDFHARALVQADSRRAFLGSVGAAAAAFPAASSAAIDVSSLRVEGGPSRTTANGIADQLKAYDGSGAGRVREIQSSSPSLTTNNNSNNNNSNSGSPTSSAATFALRYGEFTHLSKRGLMTNYQDYLVGPSGSRLAVSFDFPFDWLQLDRMAGGVQYVDQRNGDKLYLLRATLPEDTTDSATSTTTTTTTTTLTKVSKAWVGDQIFSPDGSLAKSGATIDDYKVGQSVVLQDGNGSQVRRRFTIKYATVTGNGLRVERRALVDAFQVGPKNVYMLMTSSNAVKFDKKGMERDTVEAIVDSFRCEQL